LNVTHIIERIQQLEQQRAARRQALEKRRVELEEENRKRLARHQQEAQDRMQQRHESMMRLLRRNRPVSRSLGATTSRGGLRGVEFAISEVRAASLSPNLASRTRRRRELGVRVESLSKPRTPSLHLSRQQQLFSVRAMRFTGPQTAVLRRKGDVCMVARRPNSPRSREISTKVGVDGALRNEL